MMNKHTHTIHLYIHSNFLLYSIYIHIYIFTNTKPQNHGLLSCIVNLLYLLVVQIAGKPIPTNPRLFGCNIDWVSALPYLSRINNTNLLNGFTASGFGATRYPGGNVGTVLIGHARDNWADTTSNYCLTKMNNIKKIELLKY